MASLFMKVLIVMSVASLFMMVLIVMTSSFVTVTLMTSSLMVFIYDSVNFNGATFS